MDYLTTWGREFCAALDGVYDKCVQQDAFDVLWNTFGRELSLKEFHEMTEADIARMRDHANTWFEIDTIKVEHMRVAVERTRWHWPLEKS